MPMIPQRQPEIVRKTHAGHDHGMEFVLSDETRDRMSDVIMSDGWQLADFKKNPVALGFHRSDFVVGKWNNLRIENKALRGHLELAPEGTSDRIDEIRRLVDAGLLKAVSVGFHPIESEPLDEKDPWGGKRFKKQNLVECSIVSVPANPNALAIAKSLNISAATRELVFAEQGNERSAVTRRGFSGEHAETKPSNGKGSAMSLAQRITETETKLVDKKDQLAACFADDTDVNDAELEKASQLRAEIVRLEKAHEDMIATEKLLAGTVTNGSGQQRSLAVYRPPPMAQQPIDSGDVASPSVIVDRKKDINPIDYIVRAGAIAVRSKEWGRGFDETRLKIYGEDPTTKIVTDIVLRAASAPAMTTVTGWALELAQQTYTALMPLLMPDSLFRPLSAKGLSLTFGRAAKIIIPTRSRTPTIAGSFVGEGNAIPVRQGAFTSQFLVPKKLAVISVWTKEMDEHSTPAIEGLIREAIQQDTSVAVDSVLIDANASTAVRPAGLLNGVAALTATSGGGFAALIGDLKQLIGALTTNLYGNLRNLVWLMNPSDALSASLIVAPNSGEMPFRDELARGMLNNIPVIKSSTVPVKTLILIDAADFVSVGGDSIRFDLSDQATLHMEDTTPAELVAAGSPGVVAAPQRSLFQTDSIALRMIMPLNWLIRRTGTVAWTQTVTW